MISLKGNCFFFPFRYTQTCFTAFNYIEAEAYQGQNTPNLMQIDILSQAATQARGLAIDAIHACSSGHLGLPLGCADIGAVLYGAGGLRYNPATPQWLNRDRFVLSGGHGSMFLYSWLHISGYHLSLEEVKNFRQLGSETPGHP